MSDEPSTFSYMTEPVSRSFSFTGQSAPRPTSQFVFLTAAAQLYDELLGGALGS